MHTTRAGATWFYAACVPHVRDVLIVPTDPDPGFVDLPEWRTEPPAGWDGAAVDVGDGITICKLAGDEADAVMDAAEAAGENFHATRQWSQLQTFVREISDQEYAADPHHGDNWDSGHALYRTIALSRLIHDNAFCSEYAGRIIERARQPRKIVPVASLELRLAYRLANDRPWLTVAEAEQLARLRSADDAAELPDRVKRAFWRTERSAHSPYLSEAVTNTVTGLEALLKTELHQATRQFTTRVPALATELGLDPRAANWADVYGARSDSSHGSEIALFSPPGWSASAPPHPNAVRVVATALRVLRAAIRRAIEDEQFRAKFASDDAVRAAFPIRHEGRPRS